MMASGGNGQDQEIELNLASIIDCFTVLITYLLVSASFITLGILDVTVPASSYTEETTLPVLTIIVELKPGGNLEVKTSGTEEKSYPIAPKTNTWDLGSLVTQLQGFKDRFPSLHSAMISVDDSIDYKDLVKTVETAKLVFPDIAISAGVTHL